MATRKTSGTASKTASRKKTTASKPRTRKPSAESESQEQEQIERETIECPSCGAMPALTATCVHCNHTGVITRPVRSGHETLSALKTKTGKSNDPERNRYEGDGVHPRYSDPLWVGAGKPYDY